LFPLLSIDTWLATEVQLATFLGVDSTSLRSHDSRLCTRLPL